MGKKGKLFLFGATLFSLAFICWVYKIPGLSQSNELAASPIWPRQKIMRGVSWVAGDSVTTNNYRL